MLRIVPLTLAETADLIEDLTDYSVRSAGGIDWHRGSHPDYGLVHIAITHESGEAVLLMRPEAKPAEV